MTYRSLSLSLVIAFILVLASNAFAQEHHWGITEKTDLKNGAKTVLAHLAADEGDAILVVSCRHTPQWHTKQLEELGVGPDQLDIYVDPRHAVDEELGERTKFDDGPTNFESWSWSSGYSALFAGKPNELLRQLRSSKKFYFEYHPHQHAATTAVFSVEGLPIDGCPLANRAAVSAVPAATHTDSDRQAFAKSMEGSAFKHPETHFTVDGTRLIEHTPLATKKEWDKQRKRPADRAMMKLLYDTAGFTEYTYTNDKDVTFTVPTSK